MDDLSMGIELHTAEVYHKFPEFQQLEHRPNHNTKVEMMVERIMGT